MTFKKNVYSTFSPWILPSRSVQLCAFSPIPASLIFFQNPHLLSCNFVALCFLFWNYSVYLWLSSKDIFTTLEPITLKFPNYFILLDLISLHTTCDQSSVIIKLKITLVFIWIEEILSKIIATCSPQENTKNPT